MYWTQWWVEKGKDMQWRKDLSQKHLQLFVSVVVISQAALLHTMVYPQHIQVPQTFTNITSKGTAKICVPFCTAVNND
jgi:hypothetical protein